MDVKSKTLESIHQAQDEIADQLEAGGLSSSERKALEKTSSALRNAERNIVKTTQQEVIEALKNDITPLQELIKEIKEASDHLGSIAEKTEKAAKAVEGLIKVFETAIAAGLI